MKPFVTPPKLPDNFLAFDAGIRLAFIDSLIRQKGTPIEITPHIVCPCIAPSHTGGTGHPVPDCAACEGTGFAYIEDGTKATIAVVSEMEDEEMHNENGVLIKGTIHVVPTSDVDITEGDRVLLTHNPIVIRHMRRYYRSAGGIRLPFDTVEVRSLAISELPSRKLRPLVQGKDFTFGKNTLFFPANGVVRDQTVVSGVFSARPYYVVSKMEKSFRGTLSSAFSKDGSKQWVKLPQAAIATRADILFGRFQHAVSSAGDAESGAGS